jgi:hypothetical protein
VDAASQEQAQIKAAEAKRELEMKAEKKRETKLMLEQMLAESF